MSVTQLVNPDIDRVDAVNGPATGLPFLMFKSLDAPEAPAEEEVEVAKSEAPAEEAPVEVEKAAEAEAPELTEDEKAFQTWKAQSKDGSEKDILEHDDDAAVKGDPAAPEDDKVEVEKAAEAEAPVEEAPVEKAAAPGQGHLPAGLQEILDTFVESYVRYKEAQASGAAAALAAEGSVEEALKPPVAAAHIPAPAPAPAPGAHEAPAAHEAPKAPEAHEAHEAPAADDEALEDPAEEAHEAPAEEAAEDEAEKPPFPPKKKVAKSMDELIAEAVSKAVAEAQEPLLKKIDVLERTPVDSGPMLAGQIPGNSGNPLLGRGQAEGDPAQGLVNKSAGAQAAPGAYALAEALKGVHTGTL
jgi:hypothetical protein